MAFKAILLIASALLVQTISGNCYKGCSCPSNYVEVSKDGGCFIVSGVGPVVPSGIAIASDIGLKGDLNVCGELPFLSAVAFEGCYDTKGSAGVSYGCGDGQVGIQNVIGDSAVGISGRGSKGCGCIC